MPQSSCNGKARSMIRRACCSAQCTLLTLQVSASKCSNLCYTSEIMSFNDFKLKAFLPQFADVINWSLSTQMDDKKKT